MATPAYRQVIVGAFNRVLKAFRHIDITRETLHTWDTNQVTVSSAIKRTVDWFPAVPPDAKEMHLYLEDGGPLYASALAGKVPTAGGSEGSSLVYAGDTIILESLEDIEAFQIIKKTSAIDSKVNAELLVRTGD